MPSDPSSHLSSGPMILSDAFAFDCCTQAALGIGALVKPPVCLQPGMGYFSL